MKYCHSNLPNASTSLNYAQEPLLGVRGNGINVIGIMNNYRWEKNWSIK